MRLILCILILLPWSLCAQKEATKPTTEKQPTALPATGLREVNYNEAQIPANVLPELLTAKDGRKITSSKDWNFFMDFADQHWKNK